MHANKTMNRMATCGARRSSHSVQRHNQEMEWVMPNNGNSAKRSVVRVAVLLVGVISLVTGCTDDATTPSDRLDDVVAFVDVNVIPMTANREILHDQTVLVRGEQIVDIGPSDELRVPDGGYRINAAGQFLMPGLADMHVHLEYFEQPDVLRVFIANGVTTVRNMDGREYILGWREQVQDGGLLGPRIYTAGPLLDGEPPILPDNTVVRNATEAATAVAAQADAGYDFIKVYTNLSAEAYRAVVAAAQRENLPVAGHVPRTIEITEALSGGQVAIEHLASYGELVEADNSPFRDSWHWSKLYLAMPIDTAKLAPAAQRVAESGVWTVPTLVQAQKALVPEETASRWLEAPEFAVVPDEAQDLWMDLNRNSISRLDEEDWGIVAQGHANRLALVKALSDEGGRLLVGTDTPNPFVLPGYSVFEELKNFVEAGLTPYQALAAATREAANFIGETEEWGTVERGKRADLLLLESDPLANIENVKRQTGVMVRGRWIPREELEEISSRVTLQ